MVFTDNFGIILAGHFRPSATNFQTEVILKDNTGTPRTVRTFGFVSGQRFNSDPALASPLMQIGKGTLPAVPANFEIEDPFLTAPESGPFISATASYILGSGKVTQTGFLSGLGSSGDITEVCLFARYHDSGGVSRTFLISRNIISPPVPFLIGQAVNLANEVTF